MKTSKCDVHTQAYSEAATKFRMQLREATEAEKINKLRWQVRIGDDIPSPEDLIMITNTRQFGKVRIGEKCDQTAMLLMGTARNE